MEAVASAHGSSMIPEGYLPFARSAELDLLDSKSLLASMSRIR